MNYQGRILIYSICDLMIPNTVFLTKFKTINFIAVFFLPKYYLFFFLLLFIILSFRPIIWDIFKEFFYLYDVVGKKLFRSNNTTLLKIILQYIGDCICQVDNNTKPISTKLLKFNVH